MPISTASIEPHAVTTDHASPRGPDSLVAYFWSGKSMRSRSVARTVLAGQVAIPPVPPRLKADWQREIGANLRLALGGVEPLPLPRARMRWPDYRLCVEAAARWAASLGLGGMLAESEIALMACRGANYHIDAEQYGGTVFCNLFLSEDCGLDVHFPGTGQRLPLVRGTMLVFDTAQPHGVIPRGSVGFRAEDFVQGRDWSQVFLTWELPVEAPAVARALGIAFDTDVGGCRSLEEEQVWRRGERVGPTPDSGAWRPSAYFR